MSQPDGEAPPRTGMMMESVAWRRLDRPGHEVCSLAPDGAGWVLWGTAVLEEEPATWLDYVVRCGGAWRTAGADVFGRVAGRDVSLVVAADAARRWRVNGVPCAAVAGCLDLDLAFSPATNLLPIRRLGLAVGQAAHVVAAWLSFPALTLGPLDQTYRRAGPRVYEYSSHGGAFRRTLTVDGTGFVTEYPGLWERVAPA